MLKLSIIAAILATANAYYNHGPAHQPYYGNYGHVVAPAPIAAASIIPVDPHHGNLYNHAYGNLGGLSSHPKIIPATYPGAVHKSSNYPLTNPTGYIGSDYSYGHVNQQGSGATYVQAPSAVSTAHSTVPYNHPGPIAIAPSVAYNHASVGNYAHSRYAVTEGPTYTHSRYSLNTAPLLSYGNTRYPLGIGHGIQKIAYNPALSHMGFQSHATQNYAW